MSRALIHSRWREIFDKNKENNYMPDLQQTLIECITLATNRGYNVSEIDHALHWQVEEALFDYDVDCVLPDKKQEVGI